MARRKVEVAQAKLLGLIRASVPVIWVRCAEELRFERQLLQMARALDPARVVRYWSITQGVTGPARQGAQRTASTGEEQIAPEAKSPLQMLEWAMQNARATSGVQPTIVVARDFHAPLRADQTAQGPAAGVLTRSVRDAIRTLRSAPNKTTVLILSASGASAIPSDLQAELGYVEWPLPDREDVSRILDVTIKNVGVSIPAPTNGERERLIDASLGLTAEQIANAYAISVVERGKLDGDTVLAAKAEEVRKLGLVYVDPDPTRRIGGYENVVKWLRTMKSTLSPKAREYGLEPPKGVFLAGVSGCGKSLLALVTANEWMLPLVKVDMSAMLGKYVGESEEKTDRILTNLSAMAPCIALVDEVEKVFAGMGSGGEASDGGVKKGVFGKFLTWLNDQQGVFVIATANDVQGLLTNAPEFARKGRFDELFFVDLPNAKERAEIASIHLERRRRDPTKFDLSAIAEASVGLSGAEIEDAIKSALRVAFTDGMRELRTDDVIAAMKATVPLSRTASQTINQLREWARGRCVPASPPEENVVVEGDGDIGMRNLDLPPDFDGSDPALS